MQGDVKEEGSRKSNPINFISNYYGLPKQLEQTVEECSELILAIQKYKRYMNDDAMKQVLEEIADVEIMTAQIKNLTARNATVSEFKEYKINREMERIAKKQETICS